MFVWHSKDDLCGQNRESRSKDPSCPNKVDCKTVVFPLKVLKKARIEGAKSRMLRREAPIVSRLARPFLASLLSLTHSFDIGSRRLALVRRPSAFAKDTTVL